MESQPIKMTLKLPVALSEKSYAILAETCKQYTESYNRVCARGWLTRVNATELHRLTYGPERENTDLPAQLVCSARMKATESLRSTKTWKRKRQLFNKTAKKQGRKPKKAVECPISDGMGIRYDKRSATINLNEGFATLASVKGRQKVALHIAKYYQDKTDWQTGSADLIQDRRGRFFLHLVVKKDIAPFNWNSDVVGVDIGQAHPAVTSDNKFYGLKRWKEVEDRYFRLQRALQRQGTTSAKRHLQKLARRRKRFRRDCDHVMSKRIVQSCPHGTALAVENITHIIPFRINILQNSPFTKA